MRVRRWLLGATATGAAALSALAWSSPAHPTLSLASAAAPRSAWSVVWQDDFIGPAGTLPSAGQWRFDLGSGYPGGPRGWGNHELEQYTADPTNASVDGQGDLRITPTLVDGQWRSARLETRRSDFAPPPGGSLRIEARIQLPAGGKGYWPAFWALGSTFRTHEQAWPHTGELDVMEAVNGTRAVHGTLHCGPASGGACDEPHGVSAVRELSTGGWHTYTLIWDTVPERLTWQIDGRAYATATPATVGAAAWRAALGHGYFLLLDVAIGGTWPGAPDSTTRPGASMLVDWVRVSRSS